jgi:NADPH-dependent curcumin reductase CurA
MQDRQDEVGAVLAQIATIAEEMNVIALAGSGARRTYAEQMACLAEVKLRGREMLEHCEWAMSLNTRTQLWQGSHI